MAEFNLSVVAPDRTIFEDKVSSVIAPGVSGYFGIWSGHEPLIAALDTGVVEAREANGNRLFISISGGFVEVSGSNVIILADSGEHANDIDVAQAERDIEDARRALRGEDSSMTQEEATQKLRTAMNRLKASRMQ